MEGNPSPKKAEAVNPMEVNAAINKIEGLRSEAAPTGALDSEHDFFNQLIEALYRGSITPAEALKRAFGRVGTRNLDH